VLLLLLTLCLFALVSYCVLLICYSAIRLLSCKCGIKLSVSFITPAYFVSESNMSASHATFGPVRIQNLKSTSISPHVARGALVVHPWSMYSLSITQCTMCLDCLFKTSIYKNFLRMSVTKKTTYCLVSVYIMTCKNNWSDITNQKQNKPLQDRYEHCCYHHCLW